MKLAAILPVLALLLGTLRAQTPAEKPGTVEGVVINSVTGEPLKKAVVTFGENTPTTAMTGADGRFRFDNVAPGVYWIMAERDGFQPSAAQRTPRLSLVVGPEQHVQDVAIKLMPLAVLSGHVLDDDGDPIPRAQVALLRYIYGPGPKRLTHAAYALTNDLGEFQALDLPPGRYYCQAAASQPRNIPPHTHWGHAEEAYPSIFYPNVRDPGQATAIDVAPAAHVSNIDFRMRKIPAYHIRGSVSGEAGSQSTIVDQVSVEIADSNFESNVAQANLLPNGTFDVRGVVSGSYQVMFRRFAPNKALSYSSQAVRVADADVNDVVLTHKPDLNVSGRVTVEGSQTDKLPLQINLMASSGRGMQSSGRVDPDGQFMLNAVPPEICQVQIFNVPPGKYVKSIRLGDQEVPSGEIDLSDASSATLNILLGEDGGEVDGNVQTANGQPAPSTEVTLAPADGLGYRSDLFKRASTDSSGNFQIKDVAPGEYRVFAWETDPENRSQSADFRKPFESKGLAVTVGPKDKASVQVTAITAGDVEKEMSKLP